MATMQEIRAANPLFFSRATAKFFKTVKYTRKGRVISAHARNGHVAHYWLKDDLSLAPIVNSSVTVSDTAGTLYRFSVDVATGKATSEPIPLQEWIASCPHPPTRLYAWQAHDGTQCVTCCACGAVLAGGAA